jgi:carbonic anhydrase
VLHVRHIIVCGHYGCGGVRAALDDQRHGLIDYWLQPIRDLAERHESTLTGIADHGARLDRLCELSVKAQVRQVAETPIVVDAWARGQTLAIHGWVYGLDDGLLRDLRCSRAGNGAKPA